MGINSAGTVIATAYFPVKSYHPFIPGLHVAYVVQSNVLVNLNNKIAGNTGYTLADSIAINSAGQILCNAKNSSGTVRTVLLTPN